MNFTLDFSVESSNHAPFRHSGYAKGEDVTEKPKKPLIASRVLLIGEQIVAPELMEKLDDSHLQTFMREPDPALWPPEMEGLVEYLPPEERIGFDIARVISRYEGVIESPLREWGISVFRDVGENADPQLVIDGMVEYLRQVLSIHLREK